MFGVAKLQLAFSIDAIHSEKCLGYAITYVKLDVYRHDRAQSGMKYLDSVYCSVEHDPVAGSRSNRILHVRTGSGLDWILKKLNRIRYG